MSVSVKICGIRSLESAKTAVSNGADFLGFNFINSSKRRIDPKIAKEIISKIKGKTNMVGVFQDASVDYINELADELKLDFVQLHGNEMREFIMQIKTKVIKAIAMHKNIPSDQQIDSMKKYKVDYFLLDRETQGVGDMVNSENAKIIAGKFSIFLAGGLNPDNVEGIVRKVKPYAVDVAGGIEINGAEDVIKIKQFIKNAKGVNI